MCGTGEYSIADFRANHIINGNSTEFRRVLGWFWAAVGNFSKTEMARLLQFTTGCSQLPPGGFQVGLDSLMNWWIDITQRSNYWTIFISGTESKISIDSSSNIWQSTYSPYLFQSVVFAGLRKVRTFWEGTAVCH